MKNMPEGVVLMISRLSEESLNISISGEAFDMEPHSWGTLLADLFKNFVKGYMLSCELDEEAVIKIMMEGFVAELQNKNAIEEETTIPLIRPFGASDDN